MVIRPLSQGDRGEWARLRQALWPDDLAAHLQMVDRWLAGDPTDVVAVFGLDRQNGQLGGFVELNIRNYAEGSEATQVPYVEGWYVDPDLRGQGYGKQLMQAAERWAIAQGFGELASDTEIDNEHSIAAHWALGFEETDRIVCFLKKLDGPNLNSPNLNSPNLNSPNLDGLNSNA